MRHEKDLPIGVFDSGVGGLTVLHALQQALPQESFLYLGDTARLPYGTKGEETIIRYSQQASRILVNDGIKLLVVACNTATSVALPALQVNFPNIPIVGVIEPGAKKACEVSQSGVIGVIATEATVKAQGYHTAIIKIRPDAKVVAQSCGLFVALAEEGWASGPIVEAVAEAYLAPMLALPKAAKMDCLVLGCTHYPVLAAAIRKALKPQVQLIDSAATTAETVVGFLTKQQLLREKGGPTRQVTFLVTDTPERFAKIAQQFLGWDLATSQIEQVDI
jgi:glutamate racemase